MSEMQTMRILLFGVVNAGSKKKVKRRCTFVYNEKTKELENETAMRTTYNRVDKSDPLHVVGHGAKEKKKKRCASAALPRSKKIIRLNHSISSSASNRTNSK